MSAIGSRCNGSIHRLRFSQQNLFPFPLPKELPGQLTFKTSSSKKRKLARPPALDLDSRGASPSPDTALPSCEPDDDSALSFSATPVASGLQEAPPYVRGESVPASSVPPRLQAQASSLVSADYASSVASSPGASVCLDTSVADSDRGGDETAPSHLPARSSSSYNISKKVIMNGGAELPHRSSSPLKRRASSMDPKPNFVNENGDGGDVEMETPNSFAVLPRAMSVDAPIPAQTAAANGSCRPPPLAEQVKTIETLLKASEDSPIKEGDKVYIVSQKWVGKALALRDGFKPSKAPSKADTEEISLGPVDNSDIIEDVIQEPDAETFIRLKPGTGEEDLALFPEDAWKLVMEWYGIKEGQEPIVRTAINQALDAQSPPDIMYELHPPVFRVHRLWSEVSPLPIEQSLKAKNPPTLLVSRSRKYHAQTFIKDLKRLADIPLQRKVRIFTISQPLPAETGPDSRSALTPPDSPGRTPESGDAQTQTPTPSPWSSMLLDLQSYTSVARENRVHVPLEDQTANEKYNGSASIQFFSLVTDQTLVLDEAVENAFVSTFTGRSRSAGKTMPNRAGANTPKPSSSRSSPNPDGPVTRGRGQRGYGRNAGAVGLHNLGNTCYMNSALQCVRSVEELTRYFLTDSYSEEINRTNPLGYNGKVAMAYGSLLKEIYEEGRGSVSPRDFKNTVGRCRSTFAGWGQQDSQEFLGFLLDALQEDLSRIKNKPYIEKPDSTDDMVNNPEAIKEMADQVWDITRKRDDSVIADLFTGMYKSTLKCPECGKISITFDPFNNLTLPLPVENMWTHQVKFFPLNDVPVKIEVELPRHSSIESLKEFLSIRTGVPAERLMGAEEFKDRFFKIYDNTSDVSEDIQSTDIPTFHELEAVPTNWPGKGVKKPASMLDIDTPPESAVEWDDPMYDIMVVPVLHRRPQLGVKTIEGTSPPHFITLTREEACNYDVIRRKVLEKVATFSTWSKLSMGQYVEDSDAADGDMIIYNASDADSGDGKIVSKSVQGEDDMVDVTMKDEANPSSAPPPFPPPAAPPLLPHQPQRLRQFNSRRPKFIRPDQFLDPELQSLFELSYFTNPSDGVVPTGWSSFDNSRPLPRLVDRIIVEPSLKDEDEPSPGSWNSMGSGNEESSGDEATSRLQYSQTRMNEESSEDDTPHGARTLGRHGMRPHQKAHGAGRKKFKNHKTYGKKGNKRRDRQMRAGKPMHRTPAVDAQPTPPAIADGGPLIRLHEGLVVDWNEEAWAVVFDGSSSTRDQSLGSKTFADPEILKDPALKVSQRRRASRRSRGITLEECLDEFERAEILSEQDMWYCPRCKEHRRASKKFDLWKTPDYLVAHLKRFSSSGWRRDKLDVLVDFPIEGLDLTSRVIQKEDGREEIYDLIAVDDHYGGLGGGHYTAYARNFVDGRWYNYNDTLVSAVSDLGSMVTSAAYLLFYRRRGAEQRGGERFGRIFDKLSSGANSEDASAESSEEGQVGEGPVSKSGAKRATLRSLGDDRSNRDRLPAYEMTAGAETIRPSIEDDAADPAGPYQLTESKSLDMTQSWNFKGIGASGADGSSAADYPSDDAQFDSSADERGDSRSYFETDTQMTSAEAMEDGSFESRAPSSSRSNGDDKMWRKGRIMSIPAAGEMEETDEVTEIHIDCDSMDKDEGL